VLGNNLGGGIERHLGIDERNLPIDHLGRQNPDHDRHLVDGYHHSPDFGRGHLGDIHGGEIEGNADAQSSNNSKEIIPEEGIRQGRADGRDGEEQSSHNEGALTAQLVAIGITTQRADDAPKQRRADPPPLGNIVANAKIGLVEFLGSTDHNPIVAKKKTPEGRNQADQPEVAVIVASTL
jgi:hypothetical protein